jgi:hypothetical protein
MALGLVLAFLGASTNASAGDVKQFTFRAEVPAQSADCTQQANDMASRFSKVTGLSGSQGQCQGVRSVRDGDDSYAIATIVVSYQAENEVAPTRAIFGGSEFMGEASADFPLFPTYKDCLSQLKVQQGLFEEQTKLLVIADHCDPASDAINNGFSLTLESFGPAAKHLYAVMPVFGIQGPQPGSSVIVNLSSAIGKKAQLAFVDDRRVFYYAEYELQTFDANLGFFDNHTECTDQINDASVIFQTLGADAISSFCEPEASGDVTLTSVGTGASYWLPETQTDKYSSYAECKADKARVTANETSLGRTVAGSICVPSGPLNPGQYELQVYTAL